MTNPLRPGSVREQLKSSPEAEHLRSPYRDRAVEPSDPPPSVQVDRVEVKRTVVESHVTETPHGHVEKHSKTWLAIAGMIGAAFTIVNLGISWGRKGSEYVTTAQYEKLTDKVIAVDKHLERIDQKLDDNKATDVKPIAEQATKNALDAQAKADAAAKNIATIVRGINGFNAAASRRGQPTPIPLQDP